jgi:hypothetical protein
MKITASRLRKIIKEETAKVIAEATAGSTEKIKLANGGIVLLSSATKDHISKHGEPGTGSVFSGGNFIEAIVKEIQGMDISGTGGVYVAAVPGVGYDLVLPYDEAKNLPDAKKIEVKKEERGGVITVAGFETSAPIERFKTEKLSIVVRPSKAEFLPPDVKGDAEAVDALENGKLFSVLGAWPGRDDVPPSSQWGGKWAVVIPGKKSLENAGRVVQGATLVERWQRLAGIIK